MEHTCTRSRLMKHDERRNNIQHVIFLLLFFFFFRHRLRLIRYVSFRLCSLCSSTSWFYCLKHISMLRFCIKSGTLGTHVYGFRTLTRSHILTHILKRRKSTLTHISYPSLRLSPSRSLRLMFSIEIAVVNKFEQHTHAYTNRPIGHLLRCVDW